MATSQQKQQQDTSLRQEVLSQNKKSGSSVNDPVSIKNSRLERLTSQAVFTYAGDVSDEFQSTFTEFGKKAIKNLDGQLDHIALGADSSSPFHTTRDGEVIHIVWPLTAQPGDLLASILYLLASQIPTCVIHEGTQAWEEPEWSPESRRHLAGIASALRDPPKSFAHSSSPTDLARISLWITAASAALSVPGGVKDAHGVVLPSSIGGAKSASKYLSRVISGLRSGIPDEKTSGAIKALEFLIKAWQRAESSKALDLVRANKISWGTVQLTGSPTIVKKGKKGKPDQRVITSPSKPSQSPWLSQQERSKLSKLFSDLWSRPDEMRTNWLKLTPLEQHKQFNKYVQDLKDHYAELSRLSSSVHAKLGHRKNWIYKAVANNGLMPKSKKDREDNFKVSTIFFASVKLTSLGMSVKKIFAPSEYLPEEGFGTQSTWGTLVGTDDPNFLATANSFSLEDDGRAYELWQIWASKFAPVFHAREVIPEAQGLPDDNKYILLSDSSESAK